eukprot:3501520-Amphidinium_carterae.2
MFDNFWSSISSSLQTTLDSGHDGVVSKLPVSWPPLPRSLGAFSTPPFSSLTQLSAFHQCAQILAAQHFARATSLTLCRPTVTHARKAHLMPDAKQTVLSVMLYLPWTSIGQAPFLTFRFSSGCMGPRLLSWHFKLHYEKYPFRH